jgi:hypothetical protein
MKTENLMPLLQTGSGPWGMKPREDLIFITELGTNFQDIKKYPRTLKR